jgi:hypothetical protein
MCRSIKQLRRSDEAATTGEIEAAALQFVRKISGYRAPSAKNAAAFEAAVRDISHTAEHLLEAFGTDVEEGPNRWQGRDGQIHYEDVRRQSAPANAG